MHHSEAHRLLDLALRLRGDDPYVLAHGSGVLVSMGEDLPMAQRLVDRGMQLNPGSLIMRLYSGWVSLAAGRLDEAIKHFDTVLQHDPHSARRYALLSGKGLSLFGLGRVAPIKLPAFQAWRFAGVCFVYSVFIVILLLPAWQT